MVEAKSISHKDLLSLLTNARYIAHGSERVAFELENGNVLKLPTYFMDYCYEVFELCEERSTLENDAFEWDEFSVPVYLTMEELNEAEANAGPNLYRYLGYMDQALREAIAAQVVGYSPVLVPMVECGFTDQGLFYSIWEQMDECGCGYEYNREAWLYTGGPIRYAAVKRSIPWSPIEEEIERLVTEFDLILDDVFNNCGNWGFMNGHIVICDYGYATEYDRPLRIAG